MAEKQKIRQPVERVSIIVSHGSLEGVYPGLIMANGARMEGIEASSFSHSSAWTRLRISASIA